jgi:hypothetical protein
VTVPNGLTAGPNFLGISGSDSSMSYLLVPVAAAPANSGAANVATPLDKASLKFRAEPLK